VSKPSPAPKSALKPSKFAMKVASPSIAKIAPKPKDEREEATIECFSCGEKSKDCRDEGKGEQYERI
jgi:hypothetical protein